MNKFPSTLFSNKKLSFLGSFFMLSLFIFSCSAVGKLDEKSLSDEEKNKMVNTELDAMLAGKFGPFSLDGNSITTTEWLVSFYSAGEARWYGGNGISDEGKEIFSLLSKSHYYGLDTQFYHVNEIRSLLKDAVTIDDFAEKAKVMAKVDILITDGLFLFSTHINKGYIDPEKLEIVWKKDSLETDLVKLVNENSGKELTDEVLALQPRYFEYHDLIAGLKNYLDSNSVLSEDEMDFASVKKDSALCGKQVRERLVALRYLDEKNKDIDSLAVKALTEFQVDHALDNDGKIGKNTLQMLSESEMNRYRRACLALEKWRWKKRDKEFQFRLNIPAFELTILRNDSIIHRERAITGAYATQTPELKAKMKWITLHPYWHVPHSISSTEFLYSAKRDTSYVKKAGYTIFKGTEAINVKDVNWSNLSQNNFPYRIRQNGGWGNSLGLIVFHFPNKHDVYMHDTPGKYLFKRSTRDFSHGCMRLNEPFKIGEIIMKNEKPKDTITADTLKKWALRGYEQRINLKKQIQVEVDYISVSADTLGKIIFHLDVYKRDEKYLPLFFNRKSQSIEKEEVKQKTETV